MYVILYMMLFHTQEMKTICWKVTIISLHVHIYVHTCELLRYSKTPWHRVPQRYGQYKFLLVASYGKSHKSIYKIAVNSIQCILIHSYRLNREYVTCKIFYTLFICYRIVPSKWGGSCAHCVQRTLFCKDTIRTCCNPLTHYTKAIANCFCQGGAINYK